jgi:hypothetical protein
VRPLVDDGVNAKQQFEANEARRNNCMTWNSIAVLFGKSKLLLLYLKC